MKSKDDYILMLEDVAAALLEKEARDALYNGVRIQPITFQGRTYNANDVAMEIVVQTAARIQKQI